MEILCPVLSHVQLLKLKSNLRLWLIEAQLLLMSRFLMLIINKNLILSMLLLIIKLLNWKKFLLQMFISISIKNKSWHCHRLKTQKDCLTLLLYKLAQKTSWVFFLIQHLKSILIIVRLMWELIKFKSKCRMKNLFRFHTILICILKICLHFSTRLYLIKELSLDSKWTYVLQTISVILKDAHLYLLN
jgi:hypothetical protein